MRIERHRLTFPGLFCCGVALIGFAANAARGASPTPAEALALSPVQQGVDFDRPSAADAGQCKINPLQVAGRVGWTVSGPDGTLLRKFVDTNGDNRVDRWSYYKDGLEVYRDVDTDFNRKVDQCRWFHTAGCRWGTDKNEDGQIDQWKTISAEEVAAEAVAALAAGDWPRMQRLILSTDEAKSLGLGKEKEASLLEKLASLDKEFQAALRAPKPLAKNTQSVQFSGSLPGVVPQDTDGSTKEVTVYENAMAVARSDAGHNEVLLGTLVRVGDTWRMIDVPRPMTDEQASLAAGFFFASPQAARIKAGQAGSDQAGQALLAELEEADKALQKATDRKQIAALHARRVDLVEKIAEAADSPANRVMWYHQLADMISAVIQDGSYPDGAKRLGQLYEKLSKNPQDKDLAAYVRFSQIVADHVLSFQVPKPEYEKIQKTFVENLEKYVDQFPGTPEAAEAMLQLAMTLEFSGDEAGAKKWHERIVRDAPNSPQAAKARGARVRLDSVGKQVSIAGKTLTGAQVSLDDFRGKAVLVQYWFTSYEPAKADMPALKELVNKYAGQFRVIGVCLDPQPAEVQRYLQENPLPWPQIYEEGGLDSRPANEMGIFTVPTMILVGPDGKVVNRNITVAELDKQLKTMLR